MKIINGTNKKIEIMIGHEKAEEPDYCFTLEPNSHKFGDDSNKKNLDEDNIDLEFEDLIVINLKEEENVIKK